MASNGVSSLDDLNERQREAALHTDGPLLIVAGAGAGKTKTITHRIIHLIESGVPAHRILAVTFTNKAAGEMRERVRALIPAGKNIPLLTTFHSLGVRILREFHLEAGIPRGFSIWDRDDSMRTLRRSLEADKVESIPPRAALAVISREKGKGLSAGEFEVGARNFRERIIAKAWRNYEKALHDEGALDFDDLLLRTLTLLRAHAGVRDLLQNRWTHITIDEYQDTNAAQYEIARLLAAPENNLCVVGDLDQAIYTWRQARLENLLEFEEVFPNTKVVTLEQNYRSTRTILAAANSIIEKNLRRKPKVLFTENPTGEPLSLYGAQNEIDEAWFVATKCQELIEKGMSAGGGSASGGKASEVAVLYRENFQSRALEEAFLHFNLPYRVIGTRFFERKEVKDLLSYLRAAWNPKSRIDLARAASTPSRGIGKVTLEKMLMNADHVLARAARAKVQGFRDTLTHIRKALETLPASDAVRYALEASGMEKMYKNDKEEGHERLENIRELVNFATRFDYAAPPEGIEQLLEEAALQSDQDELREEMEAISLMTVHASKGLEFDAVFITGLEQGLFPSMHESDEMRDPEEERRLFYVALTRARKRLFLSYASERMKYGSREHTLPSEFLDDIDQRLMEYAQPEKKEYEEETIR
ncbi:hypothetical protein A2851_05275 [Candidatus Kaiserbacteria bacterium RIFCSPHIGHO2_01_FULL_53_29]|uniref:DNA 3'-5' helicase n=1 Tax=Candidatus Kaiserbacteria bacterium RIFCSPHIGHO2_01_FULL_53_29 TaxID=1798480 RepID=A0A1F6CTJ6_9BACT|nr:MAG: hypothetical protein A2851_05275 [Candidatus Kaiserbacteria bacterium RIFCSPHIGHO2_01_FULL_53_29]